MKPYRIGDLVASTAPDGTVLFSDIRDFTGLAKQLVRRTRFPLLNEYFTIMVECIQCEGGLLDKFIGDAIMAAFGIPIAHHDDEDRRLLAAIAMMNELTAWNANQVIFASL